ncbi:MAG TPA: sigma-70 family RNA polymerase sigma factor [Sedimenticola sp.]|nr:sigma-70 family RNA polymerase sigma factor [Sedimenticola sp.]
MSEIKEQLGEPVDATDDQVRARQAADALIDDYHRQGGKLEQSQVDRVLDRRGLNASECLFVYEYLDQQGVEIEFPLEEEFDEDEFEDLAASDGYNQGEIIDAKAGDSTLDWLRTVIGEEPLLTPEEEKELGRQIALGRLFSLQRETNPCDSNPQAQMMISRAERARVRMILANTRLVMSISKKYMALSALEFTDLVQEGVIGLMKAVEKFDHDLGYRFSTYATWWITQAITRAIANSGRTVRFPVHIVQRITRLRRAVRWLQRVNEGRRPTLTQLEEELHWDRATIVAISDLADSHFISIFEGDDGDDRLSLVETLTSNEPGPDKIVEQQNDAQYLDSLLDNLSPREKEVLSLRFGLGLSGEWTLEMVGEKFGVTRERIRQIQEKALNRLRFKVDLQERDADPCGH